MYSLKLRPIKYESISIDHTDIVLSISLALPYHSVSMVTIDSCRIPMMGVFSNLIREIIKVAFTIIQLRVFFLSCWLSVQQMTAQKCHARQAITVVYLLVRTVRSWSPLFAHMHFVYAYCVAPTWNHRRGASNEYPQHMFCGEIKMSAILRCKKRINRSYNVVHSCGTGRELAEVPVIILLHGFRFQTEVRHKTGNWIHRVECLSILQGRQLVPF